MRPSTSLVLAALPPISSYKSHRASPPLPVQNPIKTPTLQETTMAQYQNHILSLVLLILAAIHGSKAVDYVVSNNAGASAGGSRFDKEVGLDYARQTLSSATDFIWNLFQQKTEADRNNNVQKVSLIVENIDGVAYASNNEIHLSAIYIHRFPEDIKREITGLLYHEMTHILQYNGKGEAPEGLIEGIADFVRLKAGYAPEQWVQPGGGDAWDQGYDVTARFLEFCDNIKNGFVAELNKKMNSSYSEDYFIELLGKPVFDLWNDYKAVYYSI